MCEKSFLSMSFSFACLMPFVCLAVFSFGEKSNCLIYGLNDIKKETAKDEKEEEPSEIIENYQEATAQRKTRSRRQGNNEERKILKG